MQPQKVIYIDYNFNDPRYPNKPGDGDSWFTHGFGGLYSRKFKQFNPHYIVECWKADRYATKTVVKEIENVRFVIFPAFSLGPIGLLSLGLIRELKRALKSNPESIINISSFSHLLFYSIALLLKNANIVVQHHGESPARFKMQHHGGIRKLIWRLLAVLETKAMQNVDILYVLDKEVGDWLNYKPRLIKVRSTGVDEVLFRPIDKSLAKQELGLKPEKEYLLYIGKLNKTKGPDILIDVFLELRNEVENLELILGGCSQNDIFYKKAQNAGAKLIGTIPQHQISIWMSAASVYYLPKLSESHRFGGLGMLPVQAMFCNTPYIGGTMKCIDRKLQPKLGCLASSPDEIKQATKELLRNKKDYAQIRELVLPLFSWKSIVYDTEKDYQTLLKKTKV